MLDSTFNKWARVLSEITEYSYESCLYLLKYYIHLFASLIIIMITAYVLNIIIWVGIIIITIMILRAFSGGGHSKSKIVCTLISTVYPIGCGLIINNFMFNSNKILLIISLIIFIIGSIILLRYAPADTPQKPIISLEFKKHLKIRSIMFLVLMEVIVIVLYISDINHFSEIILSVLLGLVWQLFTVLPIGYTFLGMLDRIFVHK